jgi:transcriptional regulator with XRE-family HTH domain
MPDRHLRRRGVARRAGRERSRYLARRLGTSLRDARTLSRLRQADAAQRAGVSQPFWSRLERGETTAVTLETLASCGAALGLQLAAFFERAPGAEQPRDLEHLRRQSLVVGIAGAGGWTALPEASLSDGPWSRSIDVLLSRPTRREAAVVEIWDLLLDGGQAMRGLDTKVAALRDQLSQGWRVHGLLVVRGTARNRRLVEELRPLFAAKYPASSSGWLRALTQPDTVMPAADGLAWTDVRGTRLVAARLRA